MPAAGAAGACAFTAPTLRPTPDPSRAPVIHLPTELPDSLTYDQTLPLYEYDRSVPVAVQEKAVYPRGKAVFLDEYVDEALAMADHGVASILVAGYFPWYVTPSDKGSDRAGMIGQVRELRRAIDLLQSQADFDPERIAFVGHSMGAMHGANLVAVDRRVKAAVLMVPHSTMADWIFAGYGLDPSTEKAYRAAMTPFDPIAFVPHAAPAALFFQFGADDVYLPRQVAESLYAAASEPKRVGFYDGGHDLDALAMAQRDAWLIEQLALNT